MRPLLTDEPQHRVPAPLRAALERRGFTELTAVQEAALEACAQSRDLRISSQTGSGKTVALGFVMAPALLAEKEEPFRLGGPTVLVIVPTRELAAQVRAELEWLYADVEGVTFECVTGDTNAYHERQRLARPARILVGTPGRLLDHLTIGALSLSSVEHLVLDEADQMLDMGFREDLEAILESTPTERRTHLVSATLPAGILRLAERYQSDPLHVEGTRLGAANEDIEHVAYRVADRDRYAALVNLLLVTGGERTLVFVNTRAETSELAEKLSGDGFSAAALSGELVQAQRTRTLAAFKSGSVQVLIATDVASRGLDLPDVETVVHSAPAYDAEVYTHRSGRTGRAGNKGRSLLLVSPRKEKRVRWLLRSARIDVKWRDVPTAAQVNRALDKRARRATWEALASAPDPSEERIEEARRLLEGRDPEQVLATLLDQVRPAKGPKARELGSAPEPALRQDEIPAHRRQDGEGTRFHINWGSNAGANPKRLLAHVCRRGGLEGHQIGKIRLQPHFSTFDIAPAIAEEFEARVRGRDRRDPHLRIRRWIPRHPAERGFEPAPHGERTHSGGRSNRR